MILNFSAHVSDWHFQNSSKISNILFRIRFSQVAFLKFFIERSVAKLFHPNHMSCHIDMKVLSLEFLVPSSFSYCLLIFIPFSSHRIKSFDIMSLKFIKTKKNCWKIKFKFEHYLPLSIIFQQFFMNSIRI